jgi:hypothetical protein
MSSSRTDEQQAADEGAHDEDEVRPMSIIDGPDASSLPLT